MALANCKECGKLYNKIVSDYCPVCNENIEDYFHRVSEYIYDKGPQPIHIVVQATGVKERWVMQFIHDGRLINSSIEYPCQQCGAYIKQGKICEKCIKEWNEHLKENEPDKNQPEQLTGKMYSTHSHRRGY